MSRLHPRAGATTLASTVLALALLVAPAFAQTSAEAVPPKAAEEPTAAPAAPGSVIAEQPPPPPIDPLLAEVRRQLASPAKGAADSADRGALQAYYMERTGGLVWVDAAGFTPRARDAMAEIAKADDWGLSAAAFELPRPPATEASQSALAATEIKLALAVLKYARHARGGRVEPLQISPNLDQKPALRDPKVVLEAVVATDTPSAYLTSLHPQHEQFQKLRQALLKARAGTAAPAPEPAAPVVVTLPDGPQLKLGMRHPHVALLRQRLGLEAGQGASDTFDSAMQDALRAFQNEKGLQTTGQLTPRTRALLNAANGGAPKKVAAAPVIPRLVVNMERWRWMPENMGRFHIWDNVPEYMARVVKDGRVIHSAKIVVGKVQNQTPVFSANMKYVVFHPEWGVPDSIKVKEILPYLRPNPGDFFSFFGGGADTRILERQNLRVSYNGRPVDASQVNWDQVDIRRFTFIQPAGATNVLGVVKFLFPNKHDVYMHDTPQRDLFAKPARAFSHGCVRVQDPGRLAEVLLAEDKGWSPQQVQPLLAQGYNNQIELTKQIPVHVTYFTAVAEGDGQIRYFEDIYSHDMRITAALAGRYVPPEVTADADEPPKPRKGKRRPLNDDIW
jgi:L,D-transpeptidase YcbB